MINNNWKAPKIYQPERYLEMASRKIFQTDPTLNMFQIPDLHKRESKFNYK